MLQSTEPMREYRLPLRGFERRPDGAGDDLPATIVHDELEDILAPHNSLCCSRCRQVITSPAAALEINGQHRHVCTNPYAETFEIRLFDSAACVRHGAPTYEYTWFTGYAWQNAVCRHCLIQLGWVYSQDSQAAFYGLIANRLVRSQD